MYIRTCMLMRITGKRFAYEIEQVVVPRHEGQGLTYDVRSVALHDSHYCTITSL